jgi:hypothetical protein
VKNRTRTPCATITDAKLHRKQNILSFHFVRSTRRGRSKFNRIMFAKDCIGASYFASFRSCGRTGDDIVTRAEIVQEYQRDETYNALMNLSSLRSWKIE